ncbi:MAG: hypothetical protein ONB48_05740 [candidate division KSB1 bacterium]|nr:hypothetical protein [candidate division KSB1 bacterium]MDZ7273050.1 hypothetical protein [candidate division KSB1 bacterium]MDZ7285153.1 hypothetical protein [candidate division KSB1 bacterium]MDZ7298185.1 hypothetical protein [candidate division KSB1 bacterium]MDZ7307850.1 hypothetical protein [candidate division KSB1 bacterium]
MSFASYSLLLSVATAQASASQSFGYGLAISAAMAVLGFWGLRWASTRSHKIFLSMLFGGLLFRVIIVGVALFVVWKWSNLDLTIFAASLVGTYLILQFTETLILQRHFKRIKSIRNS